MNFWYKINLKNMKISKFLTKFLKELTLSFKVNKERILKNIKPRKKITKKEIKARKQKYAKTARYVLGFLIFTFFILGTGFLAGAIGGAYFYFEGQDLLLNLKNEILENQPPQITKIIDKTTYIPQTSQEEAIIRVVNDASPAVATIIINKEVPVYEQYFENAFGSDFLNIQVPKIRQKGTEKQKIGTGTGFIISPEGLIITNKHVVQDKDAEYLVATSDYRLYKAEVLDIDPFHDIAIIRIKRDNEIGGDGEFVARDFSYLKLGDSDTVQRGQTVIAIGNPLGEFQNTVSVGVVSGLGRSITASGMGITETMEDVIQTDAAINKGNSGGPLLNLKGEVIGINTAMVEGAENLGFAIPSNMVKRDVDKFKETGRIRYAFLGIRYVMITSEIKEENKLSVNYGAWITNGNGSTGVAIISESAADKAGLQVGDIILEINSEKINLDNKLGKIVQKYNPKDKILIKIIRDKEIFYLDVILGEKISE